MSTVQGGPGNIVTSGLILNLDAANPRSYPPAYNGTTWFNLASTLYNGTLTNGPTYNTGSGGNIVFDGADDYVALGTFQALTNSFTVSFYVNPSGGGGSNIFGFYNSGDFVGWGIRIAGNNLNFWDGTSWKNPSIVVSNNIWKNVCVVISSTYLLSFYIDGILTNSLQGATIGSYTGNKVLGSRSDGAGPMIGAIAQTQIYNRALSAAEVNQNFQATRARFGI